MASNDKSYLEIKVTIIHIFVLLVAVILIGIFLFYLGYRAGKSAVKDQFDLSTSAVRGGRTEQVNVVDDQPSRAKKVASGIDTEMKLHREASEKKVESKPLKKEDYYSIQVGAFADFTNARKESDKFSKMGYPTEILSVVLKEKKLFRVRVGRFSSQEQAKREKEKLEKREKRKFTIIKSS
jgi:cell division septation protein DedD